MSATPWGPPHDHGGLLRLHRRQGERRQARGRVLLGHVLKATWIELQDCFSEGKQLERSSGDQGGLEVLSTRWFTFLHPNWMDPHIVLGWNMMEA